MNQREASAAIIKRFADRWPTESGGVPFTVDNVVAPLDEQAALPRATLNIISLDSEQYTLGPRAKVMRSGLIDVRLYGAVGEGRGRLDDLASAARRIFERRRVGSDGNPAVGATRRVVTHAGSVNELRRDRDAGGLWVLSVTFDFEFYEVSRVP